MSKQHSFDALVIGAHPDDAEMAIGGILAAMTEAGRRVMIVSLTAGESGTWGSPQERAREAAEAARILRCEHRILDFKDTGVENDRESRLRIAQLVRELRPTLVLAPYPDNRASHLDGRANVDHLASGLLARDGCKLARLRKALPEGEPHQVRRLFYYMLPETVTPSYVVDVSMHQETLTRAIQAYASQMPIGRGPQSILDILLAQRRALGSRLHVGMAEGLLSEDVLGGGVETLFAI
jgi:bacillithiol biosynthesis deacetylase BshB1